MMSAYEIRGVERCGNVLRINVPLSRPLRCGQRRHHLLPHVAFIGTGRSRMRYAWDDTGRSNISRAPDTFAPSTLPRSILWYLEES